MRGEVQFRSDKLAVLIDADNTSSNVIESLLKEITKFGTAYIKRVYGDWTSAQMNTWKKILNDLAILPDSALIIDAMDLLYMDMLILKLLDNNYKSLILLLILDPTAIKN